MENITIVQTETKPLTEEMMQVIIPECCREGHEDCPHVVNRDKARNRKNVGL